MPCRARPGRESVLVVSCPLAASIVVASKLHARHCWAHEFVASISLTARLRSRVAVREAQDERHDVMDAPAWRIVVRLVAATLNRRCAPQGGCTCMTISW
jgi:hypothetical protein